MASVKEYFDGDFSHTAKVHVQLDGCPGDVKVVLLYDFSAFIAFISCYIPSPDFKLDDFIQLLEAMQLGRSQVHLDGIVNLPSAWTFPGGLQITSSPFEMRANFHGDPEWFSYSEIAMSTRVFVYSESCLTETETLQLKAKGRELGLRVQLRSVDHARERSRMDDPLAFISHDSRDKDVARKIALGLQKLLCPVWYDEFSLEVGANLRDSIEGGLKKCEKCVLVLSPDFFSNGGWTKKEFDSIFTREILEEQQLVLPVWHGVNKKSVYEYSPSLLNVKGIDWTLGEEEVVRQLHRAVVGRKRLQSQA